MKIKTKILWTFSTMSLLVLFLGALAMNRQQVAARIGAAREAGDAAPNQTEARDVVLLDNNQVILAGAGSLIIALSIALYMGRSVAMPLQQLTKAVTGFASGKMDESMPSPREDEIGQLAEAFTNMVQKHKQAEEGLRQARDELEQRVTERTAELARTNEVLQVENVERKHAEAQLQWKTAFLEALVNSSKDGVLVVDEQGTKLFANQHLTDLWGLPRHIAEDHGMEEELRWVTNIIKDPVPFCEKISYLNSHPDEISQDEIERKDGKVFDRFSSPVIGNDGRYYGRIWTFRDITERKRADEVIKRLAAIVENSNEAIISKTLDGIITSWNPAAEKMFGYLSSEIIGQPLQVLVPVDHPNEEAELLAGFARGELVRHFETVRTRKGGSSFDVSVTISPIKDTHGRVVGISKIVRDITDRKRLEARLFQAQKLETVGKLAGGVAHEFNSILTAIIGQSELMLADLPAESPLVHSATEISKAAGRAASLTRQLLAYGRKQILQPESLDLNLVITGMEKIFQQVMGANVVTRIHPTPGTQAVTADAGQLEMVIMNMVMNAADVMPNGGQLTLETANVSFDLDSVGRYPELKPGNYTMLAITDTGPGMSEEMQARVFEPFSSTKGVGQGTGLGLSTCYGIIKQSGGHISVYSERGRGTTFKIYLPQAGPHLAVPVQRSNSPRLPSGTETILLAEDDPSLREMAATLLRRLGYTVLVAANGIEALGIKHERNTGHIDLLFTDVVMPHMSGKELADRMRALYPHTKILFTSAYTESAIVHQGVLNPGVALLQKPFTPSALARKVREVLDERKI